jgi:hypothetical protein
MWHCRWCAMMSLTSLEQAEALSLTCAVTGRSCCPRMIPQTLYLGVEGAARSLWAGASQDVVSRALIW